MYKKEKCIQRQNTEKGTKGKLSRRSVFRTKELGQDKTSRRKGECMMTARVFAG